MKTRKVHKRRSDPILTILVAVQPGGAHHQGPGQAHEDPGEGDEHFCNKCSKIYGLGRLEVQILCYMERSGKQEDAGLVQGVPPGGVGQGDLAS
jgi:hypothetical protein